MTATENTSGDQGWSEYWSSDGSAGEVFVNAQGQAHPEIAKWWGAAFSHLPPHSHIVDLACGAGSVFAHLPKNHGHTLYGADISADALALLRQRLPGVRTAVCSAAQLDYEDGQFGVVVSQFGIEYAGFDAFTEAARVLAPAGRMQLLCHIENGYIDARNAQHLAHAERIVTSNFITLAERLIAAAFEGDDAALAAAVTAFHPAEQELAKSCQSLARGIHAHLYKGFRTLYEKRVDYFLHDIVKWLSEMRADVDLNIHRLSHMRKAAKSEQDMEQIRGLLEDSGLTDIEYTAFQISSHSQPLAWALKARRC